MEVKEIIESFRYNQGKFQKESVIEARQKKEEVTEELLKELEKVADCIDDYAEDEEYFLHFYAMYLLAEFREKRAFPIIIKLITQDQEDVDSLLGDFTTEDLRRVLASTFNGEIDSLYQVIANVELDEYIRSAAFGALEILQECNMIKKDDIINKIEEMLKNELKEDDTIVIANIIMYIAENKIYSKIGLVRELYKSYRVDEMAIGGYDDFIDQIYGNQESIEEKNMIEDTIQSLSWWACFEKDEKDIDYDNKLKEMITNNRQQMQNTKQEVGRNDPCPCRKW